MDTSLYTYVDPERFKKNKANLPLPPFPVIINPRYPKHLQRPAPSINPYTLTTTVYPLFAR